MGAMKRWAICLMLAVAGALTPLQGVHAVTNQIKGNLLCNDGVTAVVAADMVTVEAADSSSSPTPFTITYPTVSSYLITFDPAKLPADKGITLTYKMAGVVQWVAPGVNGASIRPCQILDICTTKAGMKVNQVVNCFIKGTVYYKDGTTPVGGADSYTVTGTDANGKDLPMAQQSGADWAFTIDPRNLPANKTVQLVFTLNGGAETRTVQGLNSTDPRTQLFDIDFKSK